MKRLITQGIGLVLMSLVVIQMGFSASKPKSSMNFIEVSCNDFLNLSLDSTCSVTVTAAMLLEAMVGVNADYTVLIYKNNVLQSDLLMDKTDVGMTYDYKVYHNASGNSCWGKFKVEDKFPPGLRCSNDTIRCWRSLSPDSLGFPIPAWVKSAVIVQTGQGSYTATNWDACSDVKLTYTDYPVNNSCKDFCWKQVMRVWVAKDAQGNTSTCVDTICIRRPSSLDIFYPINYDDIAHDAIKCSFPFPKLTNGNPSPAYTGYPVATSCSTLTSSYTDLKITVCAGTFKVLRRWIILDWCTGEKYNYDQLIKVIDDLPPVIECPHEFTIGMHVTTCDGSIVLPRPAKVEDCSAWTYDVFIKLREPVTGQPAEPTKQYIKFNATDSTYSLDHAPEGRIWLIYIVTDLCGNSSECAVEAGVIDNVAPIAVCDQKTVVTLTNDGTAKIYAETLDDGSLDNCGIDTFLVRRMEDPCSNGSTEFRSFVEFCCEDVGKTRMVVFQVEDYYGNKNTCMVEVEVQEKEPPVIIPPSDITISCDFQYDIKNLKASFGSVQYAEADRQNIIIADVYYKAPNFIAGRDGLATDNCFVEVTEVVYPNLTCNQGTIVRQFTAKDRQGYETVANQVITIQNATPFSKPDITFPKNVTINSCRNAVIDPAVTGQPTYTNRTCSQIAANYQDLRLTILDSVCYKILRKWTVLDWCQYKSNSNVGLWEETQIIVIKNSEAPEIFTCHDTAFCDYTAYRDAATGLCYGHYDLKARGEDDCTYAEDLIWQYKFDPGNKGVFEPVANGNRKTGVLPVGTHRIRWIVSDQCGNSSQCDQIFTIRDCKKPTPYCLNGITTVIMPVNGQITVWAKDLNLNSFDNCTATDQLKFSFSEDVNYTSIVFNCDSMNRQLSITKTVRIYVTDEAGNQEYCEATIRLQDNNNVCNHTNITLSGTIDRNAKGIPNVEVEIVNEENKNIFAHSSTDQFGKYTFQSIPSSAYYLKASKLDDDASNGVTTYDIVQIQKHILGIKEFNNPYQLIAADVNSSLSVTARDIADIRRIILGVSNQFNGVPVWQFIPSNFKFKDPTLLEEFPTEIKSNSIADLLDKVDFTGVKTGDIDGSSAFFSGVTTRSNHLIGLEISDPILKDGHYHYAVQATKGLKLEGMQFELANGSKFGFESGKCQLSPENWNLDNDKLKFSYSTTHAMNLDRAEVLFYILGTDKDLIPTIETKGRLNPEIYTPENGVSQLEFLRQGHESQKMKLVSIAPNPMLDQSLIQVQLFQDTEVKLELRDLNGKSISIQNFHSKKGINNYIIQRSELGGAGIYLGEISTKDEIKAFKIIVTD
ncbi:MAG TPA: T9SS type A sorting domain-containing protein [Saprospiraceae bacterium]|nr:T9SS type A sorting domain-containing protein [Saprospiraceae bacterium]